MARRLPVLSLRFFGVDCLRASLISRKLSSVLDCWVRDPSAFCSILPGEFLGRPMQMGWRSAALGLLLHFTIAFTAAAVYYLGSRALRVLVDRAVLFGLLYGELVFLFMHFVVLPLSALGPAHFSIATYITGPVGHTVLVGLPIALSVRRFAK